MTDNMVTFKTAKLAKEKGFFTGKIFDIYPLKDFYNTYKKGELSFFIEETLDEEHARDLDLYAEAPTQSILQKWLRDNYNIHISIDIFETSGDNPVVYWTFSIFDTTNAELLYEEHDQQFYNYKGALEAGLVKSLQEIKNETT